MYISKNTPLHVAVQHNHLRLVEFLLLNGADCNLTNIDGKNPIDMAAANKNSALLI